MHRTITTVAVLLALLVLPAVSAAQDLVPAREALRLAGHDLPTPAEREEERRP